MAENLRDRLIGAWKLITYEKRLVDGSKPFYPRSEEPMGIIMYTPDGFMSAHGADGEQLWKQNTGSPIGGGVVKYLANGKQLVGVATSMVSMPWQTMPGNASVVVYVLP